MPSTIEERIPLVKDRAYRQAVLQRRLSGVALRERLQNLPNLAASDDPRAIKYSLAALLWHAAHCPAPEDRAMVENLLAEFQARVKGNRQLSSSEDLSYCPIPSAPKHHQACLKDFAWMQQVFPEVVVDWEHTYTMLCLGGEEVLREVLGYMRRGGLLVSRENAYYGKASFAALSREVELARVLARRQLSPLDFLANQLRAVQMPEYAPFFSLRFLAADFSSFRLPAQQSPAAVYNCLRRNLLLRNRTLQVRGGDEPVSCFCALDRVDHLYTLQGAEHTAFVFPVDEHTLAVDNEHKIEAHTVVLFVKNGWPIGYGIVFPTPVTPAGALAGLEGCIHINFFVFPEFAGTATSHDLFEQFVSWHDSRYQPRHIFIDRRSPWSKPDDPLYADTDFGHTTQFLLRHGFKWLFVYPGCGAIMFKQGSGP